MVGGCDAFHEAPQARALHSHIARITGTQVATGERAHDFTGDPTGSTEGIEIVIDDHQIVQIKLTPYPVQRRRHPAHLDLATRTFQRCRFDRDAL